MKMSSSANQGERRASDSPAFEHSQGNRTPAASSSFHAPATAKRAWTKQEEDKLCKLHAEGLQWEQIAQKLNRTEAAVKQKYRHTVQKSDDVDGAGHRNSSRKKTRHAEEDDESESSDSNSESDSFRTKENTIGDDDDNESIEISQVDIVANRRSWTEDEEETLRRMVRERCSYEQIAQQLGRSEGSCSMKMSRMEDAENHRHQAPSGTGEKIYSDPPSRSRASTSSSAASAAVNGSGVRGTLRHPSPTATNGIHATSAVIPSVLKVTSESSSPKDVPQVHAPVAQAITTVPGNGENTGLALQVPLLELQLEMIASAVDHQHVDRLMELTRKQFKAVLLRASNNATQPQSLLLNDETLDALVDIVRKSVRTIVSEISDHLRLQN